MDFTAVYEPQANGSVVAYIAELPGITIGARNLEEARVRLAEQVRLFLENQRAEGVAHAAAGSHVEPLTGAGKAKRRQGARNAQAKSAKKTRPAAASRHKKQRTELALLEQLRKYGWIDNFPSPDLLDDNFQPVDLPGKPLSEQIIQERR